MPNYDAVSTLMSSVSHGATDLGIVTNIEIVEQIDKSIVKVQGGLTNARIGMVGRTWGIVVTRLADGTAGIAAGTKATISQVCQLIAGGSRTVSITNMKAFEQSYSQDDHSPTGGVLTQMFMHESGGTDEVAVTL